MSIIEIDNVSRWYGLVRGLSRVSLTIDHGITGLLGDNGSGKTTLLRLLTGMLRPSSGNVTIFGQKPWNNPHVAKRFGYCPERDTFPEYDRIWSWLRFQARTAGLGKAADDACVRELTDMEVWDKRDRRLGSLSRGERQRVKLAAALITMPELLILDEPFTGVDPNGRDLIARRLRTSAEHGTCILFSSHVLHEVQDLAQHVVLLDRGRMVARGRPKDLSHEGEFDLPVRLRIDGEDLEALLAALIIHPSTTEIQPRFIDDRLCSFTLDSRSEDAVLGLIAEHQANGARIDSMIRPDSHLEYLFDRMTMVSQGESGR